MNNAESYDFASVCHLAVRGLPIKEEASIDMEDASRVDAVLACLQIDVHAYLKKRKDGRRGDGRP